jgi:hypothetical protein
MDYPGLCLFNAGKILGITDRFMQGLAALAFLGWMQGRDPDCVLDTGAFLQLRMCDPEIVGEPIPSSLLDLMIILAIFCSGSFLVWRGNRKKP